MTATSNVVEGSTLDGITAKVNELAVSISALTNRNTELERLGRAIVDEAQGDQRTVLVPTQRVHDLREALDRP